MPDVSFEFPRSGSRNLRFKHSWFTNPTKRPWLKYSAMQDGAYCLFCSLFAAQLEVGKGSHVPTGQFVTAEFRKWKNAIEYFNEHVGKTYHENAQLKAADWIRTHTGTQDSIAVKIDSALQREVMANFTT